MRRDTNLWIAILVTVVLCPVIQLRAQTLCGGNPTPLSNFCSDACITCELDGLSAITTHSIVGTVPPGYCTFFPHSMQWVGFVAGSVNLSFTVTVSNCTQGNSIELGVYESLDCNTYNLVSNCHTAMFVGTYTFSNTQPLKPGCYYYIVIDGNGPASCSIDVAVTSGSATAPEPVISGPIIGDSPVCVGETANYSIPDVFGACDYNWEVTGGTVMGPLDQNEITVLWDQPGNAEICITASNICHSSDRVCKQVYIHADYPPTYLGPFEVCAGSSYAYMGRFYSAGTWPIEFQNQFGCDTSVLLEVVEIPIETNTIEAQVCFPDCYRLGNQRLCKSGQYTQILKSLRPPFCDSIVVLDLEVIELDVSIEGDSVLDCNQLMATLKDTSQIDPGAGPIQRYWLNENGDTLGTSRELIVNEPGWYYLQVFQDGQSGVCGGIDSIQVMKNQLSLDFSVPEKGCLGSTFEVEYTGVDTSGLVLSWTLGNKDTIGSGPFTIYPEQAGYFTVILTGTLEGCPLESITDSVWVWNPVELSKPICQNTDTSLIIRWDTSKHVMGYGFTTSIIRGYFEQINYTSYNIIGLERGDTVIGYLSVFGLYPCGTIRDTVTCVFNYCPNIDLAIRPLDTLCLPRDSAAFQLSFSRAGSTNLWANWSGPGIIDSNLGRFDPKQAGEGTHTIQLQLSDSLCSYNAEIDIFIEDLTLPVLEAPSVTCINTPTLFRAVSERDYVAWGSNATRLQRYDSAAYLLQWHTPGIKKVRIWYSITNCPSDTLTFEIEVLDNFTSFDVDCEAGYDTVGLSWPPLAGIDSFIVVNLITNDTQFVRGNRFTSSRHNAEEDLHYQVSPISDIPCYASPVEIMCRTLNCPPVKISSPTSIREMCVSGQPVALNSQILEGPMTGSIRYYDAANKPISSFNPSAYGPGQHTIRTSYEIYGCQTDSSFTLEVYDDPTLTITGDTVLTCRDNSVTLTADAVGFSNGQFDWYFNQNPISSGPSTQLTDAGIYTLRFSHPDTKCEASVTINVLDSTRGPERIHFTPTDILCDDRNSGIIDIRGVDGPAGNYQVFLNGEQMAGDRMTGLGAGRHSLTVIDENGCELDTFFTIKETPPMDVQLLRDTVIALGQSVQLQTITSRPAVRYDWMPPVPCGNCPDPVVSPAFDTRYTVRAYDDQGCGDQDAAFVRVVTGSPFIPNAFTPNGDGANDFFNVFGNETVELIETMEIFDRWGNRLFSASGISPNDHSAGWDGTVNGRDVNPGVYLYCVVLRYTNGETETHCGDITLIR